MKFGGSKEHWKNWREESRVAIPYCQLDILSVAGWAPAIDFGSLEKKKKSHSGLSSSQMLTGVTMSVSFFAYSTLQFLGVWSHEYFLLYKLTEVFTD